MKSQPNLADKIHRVKFGKWTKLEDLREQLARAAEGHADDFPQKMFAYLSAALDEKEEEIAKLSWIDCVAIFLAVQSRNLPNSTLPIIAAIKDTKGKPEKLAWDYPGRLWWYYTHLIAKAYGWTLEYVAELEIDDGLSLIQEILTDNQLEREFLWGMSEIAYPYDKATKKSRFTPLPKPYWMLPTTQEIKTYKIPMRFVPQGVVIDVEAQYKAKKAEQSS